MVVDIKTVLICDAVDGACIELLEANGIKVGDKEFFRIYRQATRAAYLYYLFTQMFLHFIRLLLSKNCQKMSCAKKLRYVHEKVDEF